MNRFVAVLAACLLALPAWAASALDGLRGNSRVLREQVTSLRSQQLTQRNELSVLSSRIETLKANQKGKLLPGGELDAALKRSQEISGALSELSQKVSGREAELENANLALLDGLSAELARARANFDRETNREKRAALINDMRKLRAEREALRQTLPAARLPTLDTVKPSDDPEELLEQADLLRDNEEKLRRELKSLEGRIAERREEAELDRRVQRFMGEESMFDDSDRRLRIQRTTTTSITPPFSDGAASNVGNGATGQPATPPVFGSNTDTTAGTGGSFSGTPLGSSAEATQGNTRGPDGPPQSGSDFGVNKGLDSSNIRVTNVSDARPQVGGARAITGGNDDDLDDLEVERTRLKGLADQLKKKADELQKRASTLK